MKEKRGKMKKMASVIIMALLCASILCNDCMTSEAKPAKPTAISGTVGANSLEKCKNLFDNDAATKWCVTNFSGAYVIWKMPKKVAITGYIIVTANDNDRYNGRNPSSWKLYGSNANNKPKKNSSSWKKITSVSNDKKLKDKNYKRYHYKLKSSAKKYKYYKLVIYKTKGANVMQISEFALTFKGSSYHCRVGSSSGSTGSRSPFKKDCAMCHGTGRCQTCGGDGYLYSSASQKEDRNCYKCNASGRCTYCDGTGKQK